MIALLWMGALLAAEADPPALYRVDIPNLPGALVSSRHGSLLAAPPESGSYRPEPLPEVDQTAAPHGAHDTEEAEDALLAAPYHAAGFYGQGVKVAVFDVQWGDSDLALHEAELGPADSQDCYAHSNCEPPMDTLRPRFGYESGSHGVACAETIRDLAPEVSLYLVRVNGLTTLENAVDWAIRNEIDLVSMSLSFFNESFYDGTGAIAATQDTLAAGGVLMVSSAGNYATEHYHQQYEDRDRDDILDLDWGSEYLPLYVQGGTGARVNITWDDFDSCGRTDLDAYVYDDAGNLLARSTGRQDPDADRCEAPIERLNYSVAQDGWTYVQIVRVAGTTDVEIDVMARNTEVYQGIAEGSVTDPGSHPAVFTVGAVRADGYITNGPESFSSQGPTVAGVPKPNIAGPDGITTSIYGPVGFYGTSAATPSVAGALALLMSADPSLSARQAADRLAATAIADLSFAEAADPGLGAGRARLPPPGPLQPTGCLDRMAGPFALMFPLFRWRRRQGTMRRHAGASAAPNSPSPPEPR